MSRAIAEGLAFVPPYDDPFTIAGQGTIGDEILRQVRHVSCKFSRIDSCVPHMSI